MARLRAEEEERTNAMIQDEEQAQIQNGFRTW